MKSKCRVGATVLVLGLMLSGLAAAQATPAVVATPAANTSDVQVPLYKSRVLTTRTDVKRISAGNSELVDLLITCPTQTSLLARTRGGHNWPQWDSGNRL